MNNSFGSFVKGLLFGAVAGAVAGLLLAPKSGQATRKDLMKLADDWTDKAEDMYSKSKAMVLAKLEEVKEVGKKLDEKKYLNIVNEVITELKGNKEVTVDAAKKLSSQLKRDWNKVKEVF